MSGRKSMIELCVSYIGFVEEWRKWVENVQVNEIEPNQTKSNLKTNIGMARATKNHKISIRMNVFSREFHIYIFNKETLIQQPYQGNVCLTIKG